MIETGEITERDPTSKEGITGAVRVAQFCKDPVFSRQIEAQPEYDEREKQNISVQGNAIFHCVFFHILE